MVLQVASPAKLNLFLAVGPRDAIGYHPIRTVFQAIGLFDEVAIDLGVTETTVEFQGAEVPDNNTVSKAIRLMSEFCNLPKMGIRIKKNIPSEAGLGGGSSNAAAIVRAIRFLQPEKLTQADAFAVAQAVGSDVPFFLVGGRAKGEGYGEIITPLPDPAPDSWALVVKPPRGNSTAKLYAALDRLQYPFADFPDNDTVANDFERIDPKGAALAELLWRYGAANSGLSGSGSAAFGLFESQADAGRAAKKAEAAKLGSIWTVPLLTRAQSLAITTLQP